MLHFNPAATGTPDVALATLEEIAATGIDGPLWKKAAKGPTGFNALFESAVMLAAISATVSQVQHSSRRGAAAVDSAWVAISGLLLHSMTRPIEITGTTLDPGTLAHQWGRAFLERVGWALNSAGHAVHYPIVKMSHAKEPQYRQTAAFVVTEMLILLMNSQTGADIEEDIKACADYWEANA